MFKNTLFHNPRVLDWGTRLHFPPDCKRKHSFGFHLNFSVCMWNETTMLLWQARFCMLLSVSSALNKEDKCPKLSSSVSQERFPGCIPQKALQSSAGGKYTEANCMEKIHPDRRNDSQQTLLTFVTENCDLAHRVTVHSLQITIHLDKNTELRCS